MGGKAMELWSIWYWCASHLRPAFSRERTYLWALLVLAGLSIRSDLSGVTSTVRGLGLKELAYRGLLRFFHSDAVKPDKLVTCWITLVMRIFTPVTAGDYVIVELDGIKVPKEGRKMPAVKCLHQDSNNNSKAEYIMGHSFQVLALLVQGFANALAAVPLLSEIHEGLIWSNRDKRTLMDKAATLVAKVREIFKKSLMVVADAYYGNSRFIDLMLRLGCHVTTRFKNTVVACYPVDQPVKRKRGRPKKYGKRIALASFFDCLDLFTTIKSPVYGETDVEIKYYVIDLLWPPLKRFLRFVLVHHPTRGRAIFGCTDLSIEPVAIIITYGYRYKIELSFKQSLHVIGTYSYHFWMKTMDPLKRFAGDQYMHWKSQEYRDAVRQKMRAYAIHVTMGCIAHGLLLHLSMNHAALVWRKFGSWLRTMKIDAAPSELVAAIALRTMLPDFLGGSRDTHTFKKFLQENMDPQRGTILRLAG
jgi:hypothetical protein